MKVAIYSRGMDVAHEGSLMLLLDELTKHHIDLIVYAPLLLQYKLPKELTERITPFDKPEDLSQDIACIIGLGGDGTILDVAALVRHTGIPIFGINFGRLGFLASTGKENLVKAVAAILNGTYVIDRRTALHLDSNVPIFENAPFALNEFGIYKKDTSPMLKVKAYLNGEFLNGFWADGLIISTPTGSTGYNVSCGGPIILPSSASFAITPIAPHNLNARPIIISDDNILSFEVEGRCQQFICSLDARRAIVNKSVQLSVRKEAFTINLVRLNENTYLSTLRSKLKWGLDTRN